MRKMLALALLIAVGCSTGNGMTLRERLEQLTTEVPSLPVALPVVIPDGYEFMTGPLTTTIRGVVTESAWKFRPVEGPGELPVVEICVSVNASPTCADASEVIAQTSRGRYTVVIQGAGPADASLAAPRWKDVALTTEWRDLVWIDS